MEMQKESRDPRSPFGVSKDRSPRSHEPNVPQMTPVWSYRIIDWEGKWSWARLFGEERQRVYRKLAEYESMTWSEIEGPTGCHFVEIDDLCKDAKDRLLEIRQDTAPALFSLRITGRERVWGIREINVFRILWWDPFHEVCPSVKKHT
jgi:hypothetical protein